MRISITKTITSNGSTVTKSATAEFEPNGIEGLGFAGNSNTAQLNGFIRNMFDALEDELIPTQYQTHDRIETQG